MKREELVTELKKKINKEIAEVQQKYWMAIRTMDSNDEEAKREYVTIMTVLYEWSDYINSPSAFMQKYEVSYYLSEEDFRIMLQDRFKPTLSFLHEVYKNSLYRLSDILTDRYIQLEMISIIDRCLYEKKEEADNGVQKTE